ncbi:MAG: c-type cytochrome [Gammaproteobacteria bacterium]|nr:c-type cytochrome [Gammaproteobacteria bacterium]
MNTLIRVVTFCGALSWAVVVGAEEFSPFQPLPPQPPIPADNALSDDKVQLGRQLYFDRRLSFNQGLSCNSCHDLMAGGADNRAAVSKGDVGRAAARSAPTLWNVAYQTVYFWDGRAASLEAALAEHLTSPTEMAMPDDKALVERLSGAYSDQFERVFKKQGEFNYQNITRALASYIRTLVTTGSRFDRYLQGDGSAIPMQAKQGYQRFIDVGCASCHFWVNLSGPVPGLAFQMGEGFYELFPNYPGTEEEGRYALAEDLGRYYITQDDKDRRMWRVPVLRNIALTAPYFHNGAVPTLDEAVRVMAITQLGVKLTAGEVEDIVEFLKTLSGEFPPQPLPRLP